MIVIQTKGPSNPALLTSRCLGKSKSRQAHMILTPLLSACSCLQLRPGCVVVCLYSNLQFTSLSSTFPSLPVNPCQFLKSALSLARTSTDSIPAVWGTTGFLFCFASGSYQPLSSCTGSDGEESVPAHPLCQWFCGPASCVSWITSFLDRRVFFRESLFRNCSVLSVCPSALLCPFPVLLYHFLKWGNQFYIQYSQYGCALDLPSGIMIFSSVVLIIPTVKFAFLSATKCWADVCVELSVIIRRFYSCVVVVSSEPFILNVRPGWLVCLL